ncbi:MAG: hypothetical protein JW893_03220 [Candidatus Omnitrophica bacterium]|nr:hypothetical protein [Candidatus Omnitrophota bacterium]
MNQENIENQAQEGTRPYKRRVRNVLIHRPMQREFTMVVLGLLIVSGLAIGFVVHETIREAAFGGGFRFGKINPIEVLGEVQYQLILRISLILFASLMVLGTFGIFFLHRVAGPVYRFRQIFIRMNRGASKEIPVPVRLREGDFFHETAVEVNKIIRRIKHDTEKIQAAKEKIGQILAQNPGGDVARILGDLREFLEKDLNETGK